MNKKQLNEFAKNETAIKLWMCWSCDMEKYSGKEMENLDAESNCCDMPDYRSNIPEY